MAILPSVLSHWANRVEMAKFGETENEIAKGCEQTGLSRAAFLRQIKPFRPASSRKVRCDKGKHQLDETELRIINAVWLHMRRNNGKTMMTLERVLDILRANGKIKAEFVDEKTGEVRPYSATSIERALRNANLHPDQMLRPAPVVQLQSRHPNHVWQIDPSLCVLYYLKEIGKGKGARIRLPRSQSLSPIQRKLWAVWKQMHADGVLDDGSSRGLDSFVKRSLDDDVPWNETTNAQATLILENLKQWQKRVGK